MRTHAFRAVSGYRGIFEVAQDYDLWCRMADQGRITNIPQPVLHYRVHAGQISTQSLRRTAEEICVVLASARARASGKPDPLDSVRSLDSTVLARVGAEPEEVAEREVHYALWLARVFAHGGRDDLAKPFWSLAIDRAGATTSARVSRAHVLRTRADASRSRPLSLGMRLVAAGIDPKGTVAVVRSRARPPRGAA